MNRYKVLLAASAIVIGMAVIQCSSGPRVNPDGAADAISGQRTAELPPARQYAGEVLSYMMRVVLGDAGAPRSRQAWQTRGIDAKLDLAEITATMSDPEKDKSTLMVMDPDILGLSEVLYHYDKSLNQFKGKLVFDSLYPSTELIALRVLLLQKRSRGEKIRLSPLIQLEPMLTNPARSFKKADLQATNLNAQEMRLLKAVSESDAGLLAYLKHPFLIVALADGGFIEPDEIVQQAMEKARYRRYRCRPAREPRVPETIEIAILPSLTAAFSAEEPGDGEGNPYGMSPDASYRKATDALQDRILEETEKQVKALYTRAAGERQGGQPGGWEAVWQKISAEHIVFVQPAQRPFVIIPDNADGAVRDICPEADFAVIVLGSNVYRSIDFTTAREIDPAEKRIYLDFTDVKYGQVSEEVETITRFIVERLGEKDRVGALWPKTSEKSGASGMTM